MKNNIQKWELVNLIRDLVFIVFGIIGLINNLIHVDAMVMHHFGWFMVMNFTYSMMLVIGYGDLSETEEDS